MTYALHTSPKILRIYFWPNVFYEFLWAWATVFHLYQQIISWKSYSNFSAIAVRYLIGLSYVFCTKPLRLVSIWFVVLFSLANNTLFCFFRLFLCRKLNFIFSTNIVQKMMWKFTYRTVKTKIFASRHTTLKYSGWFCFIFTFRWFVNCSSGSYSLCYVFWQWWRCSRRRRTNWWYR